MFDNKSKIIEFLKENDWYHQRFDGSPFFLAFVAEAELKNEVRKANTSRSTWRVCFFEDGKADWYILKDDLTKTANRILDGAQSKRDLALSLSYIEKLRVLWQEDENRFYAFCTELSEIQLSNISDGQLACIYNDFYSIYINALSFSVLVDGFALSTDEQFSELLKKTLNDKGLADDFPNFFSILASASSLSFALEMQVSLLKIAAAIRENKRLENLFLDELPSDIQVTIRNEYPQIYQDLLKHKNSYFWAQNNYRTSKELSLEFFIGEIKDLLEKNNITVKIEKYLSDVESLSIKKTRLLEEVNASKELSILSFLSGDIASWQDDRKKMTFFATHYFSLILEEIAFRFSKTPEELKQLTPSELKALLNDTNLSIDLPNRKGEYVFVWHDSEVNLFTDENTVNSLRKAIYAGSLEIESLDLRGLTACAGKSVGKVRVLDTVDKINNFKDGEVLVAVMTRPDYLAAIKKATAIVTDEGGITSHAAVISRELNIPCVVGTKSATSILKNGDWVEVDAASGLIKKLPK